MSNFDYDGDEWFFLIAASLGVVGLIATYYVPLMSISCMRRSRLRRLALACLPLAALIPTYIVLQRWADHRVVGHSDYTILFLLGGGMWIFIASRILTVLGISIRDDAIERDNPAAFAAVCGILFGVGIVYALSNVGAGATIWTTIFPACVATFALLLIALLIEVTGGSVADAITIDRDVASGLRLGGAVLGCSVILGGAAAGEWISLRQTLGDLANCGWPAVLIALAAAAMARLLRPTARRPEPDMISFGVVPAGLLVAAGLLAVVIWR